MNKKIPFDIRYRDLIESGKWSAHTNDGGDVWIVGCDKVEHGTKIKIVARVTDESTGKTECVKLYNPTLQLVSVIYNSKYKLAINTDKSELDTFERGVKRFLDIFSDEAITDNIIEEDIKRGIDKLRKIADKLRKMISEKLFEDERNDEKKP